MCCDVPDDWSKPIKTALATQLRDEDRDLVRQVDVTVGWGRSTLLTCTRRFGARMPTPVSKRPSAGSSERSFTRYATRCGSFGRSDSDDSIQTTARWPVRVTPASAGVRAPTLAARCHSRVRSKSLVRVTWPPHIRVNTDELPDSATPLWQSRYERPSGGGKPGGCFASAAKPGFSFVGTGFAPSAKAAYPYLLTALSG